MENKYFLQWMLFIYAAFICGVSETHSMPIGFGRNQGSVDYDELITDRHRVYFDRQTPGEGQLTLRALERAEPHLEKWFDIKHERPMRTIISSKTDQASFANFITDALEIQTMGQASRDLVWHEYTHANMYAHLENWLGPAGSVLHLPWMPAWWIEGLAETMSVSVGSDLQAGYERYHALTQSWPSYARIHSLYSTPDFSLRGYATSGAFVAHILRSTRMQNLRKIHQDFFEASRPWLWLWAIIPFAPSMPMDVAFRKSLKKEGEQLYEEYKAAAQKHWQQNRLGELVSARSGERLKLSSTWSLQYRDDALYRVRSSRYQIYETKLKFAAGSSFVDREDKEKDLPNDLLTSARVISRRESFFVQKKISYEGDLHSKIVRINHASPQKNQATLVREARVENLFLKNNNLYWLEQRPGVSTFCYVDTIYFEDEANLSKKVLCPVSSKLHTLSWLGQSFDSQKIWLLRTEQTRMGDRHQIIEWHTTEHRARYVSIDSSRIGAPVAMTKGSDGKIWMLAAHRSRRVIQHVSDEDFRCHHVLGIDDTPFQIFASNNPDQIIATVLGGDSFEIAKISVSSIAKKSCDFPGRGLHTSPLIEAERSAHPIDLNTSLELASLWREPNSSEIEQTNNKISREPTLDESATKPITPSPRQWRARPIVTVPWIGADTGGFNYGLLSVPLMDDLQNETIRGTALYGLASRFPSVEVSFQSTRYWPTLQLDVFRYQSWNGTVRNRETRKNEVSYLDEQGSRASASVDLAPLHTSLAGGIKSSFSKPYLGPADVRSGALNELFAQVGWSHRIGIFGAGFGLSSRWAPGGINSIFDYRSVAFSHDLSLGLGWRESVARLHLDASQTQGSERKNLQESYRPLRVFVPGDGAALTSVNFPVSGSGASFEAEYGDTQARASGSVTVPVLQDIEKMVRLFYLDQLNATVFYNYGGAWNKTSPPDYKKLSVAYGTNLDLVIDVKGVHFSSGAGFGRARQKSWDVFFDFGFDAVF